MRLVTWNCHFGLTESKANMLMGWVNDKTNGEGADVYFIQEVMERDIASYPKIETHLGRQWSWYSDHKEYEQNGRGAYRKNHDLGIAVFSKNYILMRSNEGLEPFRYVVPYDVCNKHGQKEFTVFHVWTKGADGQMAERMASKYPARDNEYKYQGYADIVTEAMLFYSEYVYGNSKGGIFSLPFIIVGDFNFGSKRDVYYPNFDEKLKDIVDVTRLGDDRPTHRHSSDKYDCMNDCCYISKDWEIAPTVVGEECVSDHLPVMAELNLKGSE